MKCSIDPRVLAATNAGIVGLVIQRNSCVDVDIRWCTFIPGYRTMDDHRGRCAHAGVEDCDV